MSVRCKMSRDRRTDCRRQSSDSQRPSEWYTGWGCRMSHRKWNNGPNRLNWPLMPIQPVIPFCVRHSVSPSGNYLSFAESHALDS